ncbi:PTS glucitol/sorbitol transporter subunit IIA [Priestia endophytica]|uniref:PTS glucitol/sorbitol transporter subunit IIA n=1 Tax=Priestia endophytica TaxID=135735 RepID=UPI000DE5BB46|nr:PTS glucitol/sorbitol transporter subunit IIA [Priestia endophytica]
MKTIYQSIVTEVGSQVELFLQEKMIILFNDSAPDDLRDVSVVHKRCPLEEDIKIGDELVIDNQSFKVTFVGDKVNETMRDLGHSTITFDGSSKSEMPGMICVEAKEIPAITSSSQLMFRQLS